jgi:hypothetical protein
MQPNKTAIERAFELARSGQHENASAVKRAVAAEGYPAAQIEGPALMRQLRDLIQQAAAARPPKDS